jgi:hypothetical protein
VRMAHRLSVVSSPSRAVEGVLAQRSLFRLPRLVSATPSISAHRRLVVDVDEAGRFH